jgi:SAM-dependent methyltransferase
MTDASAARAVEKILAGHMSAVCLIVGHQLGLFELLARGPLRRDEIAGALGIENVASLDKLLHALVGEGLVVAVGDGYANGEVAEGALVDGRPGYWGGFVDFFGAQFLSRTTETLAAFTKRGATMVERHTPQSWRDYMRAMECMAHLSADTIARELPLGSCRTLLDLAGGPGDYAIAFCAAHPHLRVILRDLPQTLEHARPNVARSGFADRVDLVPGSMGDADYGNNLDAVFLSQTLHLAPEEAIVEVLRGVHRALVPGGLFVVREVFVDDATRLPLLGSLLGFHMWVHGGALSFAAMERMLRAGGFIGLARKTIGGGDGPDVLGAMILARKPGATVSAP